MRPIRRLLIANRGEIALRIIRTARSLGIHTIALYSDADARALHVEAADEAWPLGPAPARDSYLNAGKVLAIARAARADAIHPGYGFLSENSAFAEQVEAAGLCFVGPPATAIRAMGDKAGAKALMAAAGVPLLPGYHGEEQTETRLLAEARHIGMPLLIKAAAGGGGKGMRRVDDDAELLEALAAVKREARSAFGDDAVLLERYLERARHVEVQLFCDHHGQGVYLGDRDCSLQRRHQKVIEEAPAPGLSDALRRAMGEASVKAALAIGYVGAGTMEYLVCGESFFFMEMNTRLQVEHPVTECITGQDLVAWQLQIAQGAPLPLSQADVTLRGHAVEARLYAEDVAAGFLPASGDIDTLVWPQGVRIDSGVREGDTITPYYDPMLAKLIAHGPDRAHAFTALAAALDALTLAPLIHNAPLLARLCREPDVLAVRHHTQWPLPSTAPPLPELAWLAAALWLGRAPSSPDPWQRFAGFRVGREDRLALPLTLGGEARHLSLNLRRRGAATEVQWHGHWLPYRLTADAVHLMAEGRWQRLPVVRDRLHLEGQSVAFGLTSPQHDSPSEAPAHGAIAPMHALVVQLLVSPGQQVHRGQPLVVLEAMKMEHTLRAGEEAVVAAVHCRAGEPVSQGARLVSFTQEQP
ncbi:acetyl/propionyl/methylcrotonyl-CoA carboxylase subunit alpha [Aeromonas simiae]|uniref:acetyl/propionyl/methylcrotonyl-CoA carboxylase subunit alpha n=2 Tax=Aeromonas simiae TaxID=218936 RepID=UPI00266B449E|nr:biotin carboxylase N-terminal domain-containing protein [Aeromonas simiae]MDO2953657.1 methylcrotonoyl-CoA carboxylase [Aeromonas simiae]